MTELVGRPIPSVGMALRATIGDEHPVLGFSMNLGKAGRGASRGPGGPPYFGLVFYRAVGFQHLRREFGLRKIKGGGAVSGEPGLSKRVSHAD
jgi:hypothetical protein